MNEDIRVIKHIAILSDVKEGWQKELNIVSINDEPFTYDVREWSLDHEKSRYGVTLDNDEARKLFAVLQECLKDGNGEINLNTYPGIYKQESGGQISMFVEKDKNFYQTDNAPTEFLKENKINFIDKREKGGALWIIGGHEIDDVMKAAAEKGFKFIYSEKGGRVTKGQPGWFLK